MSLSFKLLLSYNLHDSPKRKNFNRINLTPQSIVVVSVANTPPFNKVVNLIIEL